MVRVLLPRRRVLTAAGGVLASPMLASGIARANADWPTKSVRYINLFPAGVKAGFERGTRPLGAAPKDTPPLLHPAPVFDPMRFESKQ